MVRFSSQWRSSMVDCDVIRNGTKIATYNGLINDNQKYNFISFDPDVDIQVGDEIFCPIKRKNYIITNTDIVIIQSKRHRLDAYFENNFKQNNPTNIFNTYNPTNSIIGSQQYATININDSFNELEKQIETNGGSDKEQLLELKNLLQQQMNTGKLNKGFLAKFSDLIAKHSWLMLSIAQIIAAWIQG